MKTVYAIEMSDYHETWHDAYVYENKQQAVERMNELIDRDNGNGTFETIELIELNYVGDLSKRYSFSMEYKNEI